ncbi:MAG TPA: hypothetical protein VEU98_06725 [Candidatus Eremiobacteraceae bacterium]|nr:hypothetical protein [Candidatus Eremiobacteraceae bacterium]
MFGSAMLDVAIGMIFVFLLLCLICSAFSELLETFLKKRSKDLEQGIIGLLGDKTGLVDKLYNHGLIFSLYRGTYAEAQKNKTLPSYIPSANFAKALTAILTPDNAPLSMDTIKATIAAIANPQVKSALTTLANDAANDMAKFRAGLEEWFDSAMDRVSGWYKRRTHVILFFVGFLIAITLNVNSISLAQDLWTNAAMRDALVGAAQGYLDRHPAPSSQSDASTSSPTSSGSSDKSLSDLGKTLNADIATLKGTKIPIGWGDDIRNNLVHDYRLALMAVLGWLLTACAASLGAPFWFDLLNKVAFVRSSIKPGEKSAPAAAK